MERLINKLYKLVEQRTTTFSNGKSIKDIVEIYKPLVADSIYTNECKKDYNRFLISCL